MNITYRVALETDAVVIADLNCRLAMETEGKILDRVVVGNGVLSGIKQGPEVRYFVAQCDGKIIGQLMLTREWSDWRNGWMIWLQSIYVLGQFRRCGVFRSLFHYAISTVRDEMPVDVVRLYVEQANETAKSCYKSLGFKCAGYEVLEIEFENSQRDTK
jgi:ribosomal protein S18 acetylase RimI-like enzyme